MTMQKIQKIVKRWAIAIATTITIAISAAAPSQAIEPTVIIDPMDGRPPVAVFARNRESYGIGCPELDQLWSDTPYRKVSADEY